MAIEDEGGYGYVFKGFASRLRERLEERKMTQAQLALAIGKTPRVVSMYLSADRTPRADVLTKLAGALGVTTDYLCVGTQPGLGVFRDKIRDIASMAIEFSPRDLASLENFAWALKYGDAEVRELLEHIAQMAHRLAQAHIGYNQKLFEREIDRFKAQEKQDKKGKNGKPPK